jgi:D-amino-acid dehydrogenase
MHVVVLGAGVIGVTTAHELSEAGAEVTVIDRAPAVAQETSAVNAGLLAPGHAFTWANPRAIRTLARSLVGADTALRMHWRYDPELWSWGIRFLRNCTVDRMTWNTLRRVRISQYSRSVLDEIIAHTGVHFDENRNGALFLFRDAGSMQRGVERLRPLRDLGEAQEVLDADGVIAVEPAFEPVRERIVGAVFSPTTMSGDSSLFATRLAERAAARGVRFELGRTIEKLIVRDGHIVGVRTDEGVIEADRYVLALGVESRRIARTAGLRLPIYPVKGYTMTTPVSPTALAPKVSGIDEDRLVAWSRFGDRIRMTGTADFAGHDRSIVEKDARSIFLSGGELFPDAFRWEDREMKVGLRPVTSDENPLIGATRYPELVLNTGHGNLGWVMAAGSARLAAAIALGEQPELDPVTFTPTGATA